MARSILALALLGMLVFASAERSLLAHKVQGGQSLHAVALSGSLFGVPFSGTGAVLSTGVSGVASLAATPVYYLTNGNGTWAPNANGVVTQLPLALPQLPTGGVGVISQNGAYLNAVQAPGALYSGASPPATVLAATGSAVNTYFLPTAVANVLGAPGFGVANLGLNPAALPAAQFAGSQFNGVFASGVTAVTFPSKSLGVAVGLNTASIQITGNQLTTAQSSGTGAANLNTPTIIITVDQGLSWNMVSGFSPLPTLNTQLGQLPSYPQFLAATQAAGPLYSFGAGVVNTATNGGITGIAPDLTSVFCASKNLCFAAGGFMPLPSTAPGATTAGTINTGIASGTQIVASDLPSWGQILRSTNGGTYWTYTPLPMNYMPSSPLCTFQPGNGALMATTQASQAAALAGQSLCPVPGLLAIGATANGKIVVAAGAPGLPVGLPGSLPGATFYSSTASFASTVSNFGVVPTPVILYSSNSGASYAVQQAPVHPGGFLYILNSVVVIKSTLAFAAGGNPYGTQGSVSATSTTLAAASTPLPAGITVAGPAVPVGATVTQVAIPTTAGYSFRGPGSATAGSPVILAANGGASATYTTVLATNTYMVTAPVVPAGGIVIASFNGGFTWAIQSIASYTYTCTNANSFGITYSAQGVQSINTATTAVPTTTPLATVYPIYGPCGFFTGATVQAYSPTATQAANTIPAINAMAFTQGSNNVAQGTTGTNVAYAYNGWAVGDSGMVLKATVMPSSIATIASTASNTIITTWNPVLIAGVSSGSGFMNLYGIVWDNNNVGYIFGASIIISTHNGGVSWQVETPNNLIAGSAPVIIPAAAIVPTNY